MMIAVKVMAMTESFKKISQNYGSLITCLYYAFYSYKLRTYVVLWLSKANIPNCSTVKFTVLQFGIFVS